MKTDITITLDADDWQGILRSVNNSTDLANRYMHEHDHDEDISFNHFLIDTISEKLLKYINTNRLKEFNKQLKEEAEKEK